MTGMRNLFSFRDSQNGNIAVTFALALIPILSFVGAAVDYSRVSAARTSVQSALDSAGLMVTKDYASSALTANELTQKAQIYFDAIYNKKIVPNIAVTAAFVKDATSGSTVNLTGSGSMPTEFMKIIGTPSMEFTLKSSISFGLSKFRVALVLDNTYSMNSDGKMPAMQTAAKSLIDKLSGFQQTQGDVLISIVPFNVDVNVGTLNANQPWLDWSIWDSTQGTCSSPSRKTQSACVQAGKKWTPDRSGWTGCVEDRSTVTNMDTLSSAPTPSNSLTLFTPVQESFYNGYFGDPCPQKITPLSYDWTALKASVNAMQPNGTTNQQIGLVWGWLSLLPQAPLNAPAQDPTYTYKNIIILLSDGDNTANATYPWDGTGSYPSQSTINAIDARQKMLCDDAKAAGVVIYTIQVNTDGTANSSVMSYCASGSSNYFPTTSASGISAAFDSIGSSLTTLRIAR